MITLHRTRRGVRMALAATALVAATSSLPAQAANAVVGTLTCKGEGTLGLILGSKETLQCKFTRANGGPVDQYDATITKIGLDIGIKGPSTLIWTVLGSTSGMDHDALMGTYAGVSAQAAVAVGAGANALIGGSNDSVVLQPLSVEGQTGINLAVGVSELVLR